MVTIGTAALAACGPPTFPRHRWTGFVDAVSWPFLMESIHGLLGVVYRLWASRQRGGGALQAEREAEQERAAGQDPQASRAPLSIEDEAEGGRLQTDALAARRIEQSQDRDRALEWLAADPFGMMCIVRLCIAPLAGVMDKYLSTAGPKWERSQAAKEAQALLSGLNGERDYRVSLAAVGDMTRPFLEEVRTLMAGRQFWEH